MEADADLPNEDTDQITRPTVAAVHKPPRRVPVHERQFSIAKQKLIEGCSNELAQAGLITGALAVAVFVLQHKWRRRVPPPLPRTSREAESVKAATCTAENDAQLVQSVHQGEPPGRCVRVHAGSGSCTLHSIPKHCLVRHATDWTAGACREQTVHGIAVTPSPIDLLGTVI